jgi:hypothetical protein
MTPPGVVAGFAIGRPDDAVDREFPRGCGCPPIAMEHTSLIAGAIATGW